MTSSQLEMVVDGALDMDGREVGGAVVWRDACQGGLLHSVSGSLHRYKFRDKARLSATACAGLRTFRRIIGGSKNAIRPAQIGVIA